MHNAANMMTKYLNFMHPNDGAFALYTHNLLFVSNLMFRFYEIKYKMLLQDIQC